MLKICDSRNSHVYRNMSNLNLFIHTTCQKNGFLFLGGSHHPIKSFHTAFTTSDTAQLPLYRKMLSEIEMS